MNLRITNDIKSIFWFDIEICRIVGKNEIILNKVSGLSDNFLRLVILGTAIPLLLIKRGHV